MSALYVYEPWPAAVDTNGLCGPLTPTKATCTQEKNGDFRLDIEHPIDEWGKWTKLAPGNLVKAYVPLRTTPIIPYGDLTYVNYITSLKRCAIKSAATRTQRSVFSAPIGLPGVTQAVRLDVLPAGTNVYVIGTTDWMLIGLSWSAVAWAGGRGWIDSAAIDLVETLTLAANRSAIEAIIPSQRTRPQLFRVDKIHEADNGISAQARHVSYDAAAILQAVTAPGPKSASTALTQILLRKGNLYKYVLPQAFTNSTTQKDYPVQPNVGTIEAMLGTSDSLTATWAAYLLRDNWVYTFLTDPAYTAGYLIEYGKNLKGISIDTDMSGVQDGFMPLGQTVKGNRLQVPSGTYTVDDASVTVSYGIVSSPNYSYPTPHQAVLDLGSSIKAAGTDSTSLNAAYVKLIRAALAKFADEQCDLPEVTISVDFLHLGDTAEYAQYRDLQKLFLYDTVRVKHPRLGIDVTTQVNKTTWDCLNERYDSIELGSVRKNYARSRLAGWQIPGLDSLKSYVDTISGLV